MMNIDIKGLFFFLVVVLLGIGFMLSLHFVGVESSAANHQILQGIIARQESNFTMELPVEQPQIRSPFYRNLPKEESQQKDAELIHTTDGVIIR